MYKMDPNAYDNEIDSIRSEILEKIQPQLKKNEDFGVEFVIDGSKLCSGLIKIKGEKRIAIFNSDGDRLKLEEATQLLINEDNKPLEKPSDYNFIISSIDMNSFKVITKEQVENRKREVISKLELGEKQGSHMGDISKSGFKIDDPDATYKVPIDFNKYDEDHVVAISEPINVDTIFYELPKQTESPTFEAKKIELQDFIGEDSNKVLLEGSIIMESIKTTLAKNTQTDLKARYDSLKESIKQPLDNLNTKYTESLKKLATDHNSGINAQIKKTKDAAVETRRKYKMAINKTKKAVNDRLAGTSKGVLGKIMTGSKLQNLGKSLLSDELEIVDELAKAKRYTGIKKMLLDWSKASQDKSELTDKQIEVIVEAFPIVDYEKSSEAFIEKLKINTMSIISLILEELELKLDVFKDTAPHHLPKFLGIVKKIMESLLKITNAETKEVDDDKVEEVLKNTIAAYGRLTNNDYLTPMKLQDIKATMLAILQSSKSTSSDDSDTKSEGSTATGRSIASLSSVNKRREIAINRADAQRILFDTFTPAIKEIEADISEYIPDIKQGQLLLITEQKQLDFKTLTNEFKAKYYYLDVDGKVKKIGSSMIYKLAINDDGSIPPQLSSMLTSFQDKVYTPLKSKIESQISDISKRFKPVYGSEQQPAFGPKEAPKKGVYGNIKSLGKGLINMTGLRQSLKNNPTQGGKHRTRKNRKNKTRRNKKYGRR